MSLEHLPVISAGLNHIVMYTGEGIFSYGMNIYGQLGLGDEEDYDTPQKIRFFDGRRIQAIAAGGHHTLVIAEGSLYAFGSGEHGQLGLGDENDYHTPQKVSFFDGRQVEGIATAGELPLTVAVTSDGKVFMCGRRYIEGVWAVNPHFTRVQIPLLLCRGLSRYWYPLDREIQNSGFEETSLQRGSVALVAACVWTWNPWVREGVDELLCDVLSYFPNEL